MSSDVLKTASSVLPAKTADDTRYTLRVPIYSSMTDDQGRILPGVLLKLIDVAGCVPAKRHLGKVLDPMTASIDRMDFYAPIYPWEIVILNSRLTRVWRTSIESRVVVTAWSFRSDEMRSIATAYMVTVAVKDQGRAKALPEEIAPLKPIAPEDRLLMRSADLRKEYRSFERSRTPFVPLVPEEDHPVILEAVMTPRDSNGLEQNIFGGVILSQMHQAAQALMGQFVPDHGCVCVRQDRMDFVSPAHIGDTLRSKAAITQVFHTSIEVQVECEAQAPGSADGPRLVATTYFMFVRVDEAGQPVPAPRWLIGTPRQEERAQGAAARRRLRADEASIFGESL
jgi:acyl-CoA hydrolase